MTDNQQSTGNAEQTSQTGTSTESNQHGNAAGQSGEGGFKAISSEAELAAWKAETRKQIVAEVKRSLKEQADADKAKEQGEFEKLYQAEQAKAADAQKRAREKSGKSAAVEAARAANAISGTAIYALIRDRLEYDDDDEPTNLERLIADARKAEPSLFQASAGSGDGGRGNNGKPNVDGPATINQLIRQATGVIS